MPEVVEDIIKETSQKVIIDRNEKAAIQPKITFYEGKPSEEKEKEEIDKVIKLEKELSYKMTYEIMPEITLPKYESISVVKKIAEVTTEDIDESLLKISEENKSFTEKNDKEKAEVGDQVTIDFIGKIDGEVFEGGSANDAPLILGSGSFIPGFEDQLEGASKDKDLDMSTLISLICSCLCSAMVVQRMVNFPFKSPPIMMMLAACCFLSCCSSVMLTKDTYDRFTHKSE